MSGDKGLPDRLGVTTVGDDVAHMQLIAMSSVLMKNRQRRQLWQGSKCQHQPCAGTLCLEIVREAGWAETRRHQQNDAAGCTQCIFVH